jgi:predicted TIM-barrel fold metal-dependent hydrolase
MKLDMFAHLFPRPFYEAMVKKSTKASYMERRAKAIPILVDLEQRFRVMDQFPDYQQVLSLASPPIEEAGSPEVAAELARIANDSMAELVAKHPQRFPSFAAAVPMNNMDACVAEVDRAITQLGAGGVQLFTNVNGRPVDEPEFRPLFERIAAHDAIIWLHPARGANFSDYASEKKSKYEIWFIFGWPYETTAAITRIIFSGILDEFPNLKIIGHHTGAMIPFFEGRLAAGMDTLGTRTPPEEKDLVTFSLKRRPVDYFRMIYGDTASFGGAGQIQCGIGFFGIDQILFASDMPFDPEKGPGFIRDTIKVLDSMILAPADREKIYVGNALRLLKKPAA